MTYQQWFPVLFNTRLNKFEFSGVELVGIDLSEPWFVGSTLVVFFTSKRLKPLLKNHFLSTIAP